MRCPIPYFKTVASLSRAAYGAEAQFQIAQCQFDQNRLKDAEKSAFEVIHKSGSYELWVTKSYFLLGDIYLKEKGLFQCKSHIPEPGREFKNRRDPGSGGTAA